MPQTCILCLTWAGGWGPVILPFRYDFCYFTFVPCLQQIRDTKTAKHSNTNKQQQDRGMWELRLFAVDGWLGSFGLLPWWLSLDVAGVAPASHLFLSSRCRCTCMRTQWRIKTQHSLRLVLFCNTEEQCFSNWVLTWCRVGPRSTRRWCRTYIQHILIQVELHLSVGVFSVCS